MKVISLKIIRDYIKKQSSAKQSLLSWYYEALDAKWKTPQDIKNQYNSASFLENNIVIFNIKGNKYRLVTKIAYNTQIVFIKWIGIHSEYNKINFKGW